ncbi:hypothetical protein GGI22_000869 [Coemansia erecta]|nr:hypothetical protein GGI22_000869 [Coemansia erecta]
MLKQHRERQAKLLPLFSPELRATRMAFLKGLRDMFIIFTIVYWITISFLYGSGYNTTRYMHEATTLYYNMDDSTAASILDQMIAKAYASPGMLTLTNATGREEFSSIASIRDAVWRGDYWNAVVINEGFGERLQAALENGADYDPTSALTFYTEESRHYFKVAAATQTVEVALTSIEAQFAQTMFINAIGDTSDTAAVISRANPAALVRPYSYTVDNIAPYHFDMALYLLSVTLSLSMVAGSFIPSNMWKSIEEPFYKQVRIRQVIALRFCINVIWAVVICLQSAGIAFVFRGSTWSPTAGDYFAMFAIFLLNTLAFTFYIDCLQNWIHPKFLIGAYFTTLLVNISGAMFGPELNNHFFRITYALPFFNSGLTIRTLLTGGSYNKIKFSVTINILWTLVWWTISTFLIARKARLVRAGTLTMANVPPPPAPAAPAAAEEEEEVEEVKKVPIKPSATAGDAALPAERLPQSSESLASISTTGMHEREYASTTPSSSYFSETPSSSSSSLSSPPHDRHRRRHVSTSGESVSDIEIEDS